MSEQDLRSVLEQAGKEMTVEEISQLLTDELAAAKLGMSLPDILETSKEIAAETTDRDQVLGIIKQAIAALKQS